MQKINRFLFKFNIYKLGSKNNGKNKWNLPRICSAYAMRQEKKSYIYILYLLNYN